MARKGAQPFNRNALRHGFYAQVLDEAERAELEVARGMEGLDEEIAMLRTKIQGILEKDPNNVDLLLRATGALSRLMKTRYNLEKDQGIGIKQAIGNVLKEIAIPLGIKALQ